MSWWRVWRSIQSDISRTGRAGFGESACRAAYVGGCLAEAAGFMALGIVLNANPPGF